MGASEGALPVRPIGWTLPVTGPVAGAVMTGAMWRRKMLKASGNSLPHAALGAKSARRTEELRGRDIVPVSRKHTQYRSKTDERRVGKEGVRTSRYRRWPY